MDGVRVVRRQASLKPHGSAILLPCIWLTVRLRVGGGHKLNFHHPSSQGIWYPDPSRALMICKAAKWHPCFRSLENREGWFVRRPRLGVTQADHEPERPGHTEHLGKGYTCPEFHGKAGVRKIQKSSHCNQVNQSQQPVRLMNTDMRTEKTRKRSDNKSCLSSVYTKCQMLHGYATSHFIHSTIFWGRNHYYSNFTEEASNLQHGEDNQYLWWVQSSNNQVKIRSFSMQTQLRGQRGGGKRNKRTILWSSS